MLGKTVCIMLSGKAGTGKSTSANIIRNYLCELCYVPIVESFADGVKKLAFSGFGWDGKKDQAGRKLLQKIGAIGREYNEDIWVIKLLNKIYDHPKYPVDFLIIDDWRFPNEEAYIRKEGLYSVHTIRIVSKDREILKGTPEYDDISEVSLDGHACEYVLYNNGGTDDLEKRLVSILDEIILKEDNFGG